MPGCLYDQTLADVRSTGAGNKCLYCSLNLVVFFQGTFLVTQAVAQAMVEAKVQTGSIVNIASIVAKASSKIRCSYL